MGRLTTLGPNHGLNVGKKTEEHKIYALWTAMHRRCYSQNSLDAKPRYEGCTICDEWRGTADGYKAFREFHVRTYRLGYQLDKDLLVHGNKVYGPETCMYVPQAINKLFTDRARARGPYPMGVSRDGPSYRAACQIGRKGKPQGLGAYRTPEEAHDVYRTFKRDHCYALAAEYLARGDIDDKTFQAVLRRADRL